MRNMQALSDVVVLAIKAALAPLEARLAASEQANKELRDRVSELAGLRDRVTTIEAKPIPPSPALEALESKVLAISERVSATELRVELKTAETVPLLSALADLTKDVGLMRERVAVVEVRPSVPGPQGEPGPPGKDGVNGTAGLSFEGVYQEGKSYDFGHLVTWGGSSWHCNEPTTSKPGEGTKAWTLMVKRGRDGKDGRDAATVPVVRVG